MKSLDLTLQSIDKDVTNIIIGDLNIDIKANNTNRHCDKYLDLIASYGYNPTHFLPTRDANCIDHIIVKSTHSATAVVCQSTITDHYSVLASITTKIRRNIIQPRVVTKTDFNNFENKLLDVDWSSFYDIPEANQACDYFTDTIIRLLKESSKTYQIPHRIYSRKAWITPGLVKCMKKRDFLHLKTRSDPKNLHLKQSYIKYRNTCNFIITSQKNLHDQELLKKTINDPKKMWKTVKSLCYASTSQNNNNDLLTLGNNPAAALNTVNNFFTSVWEET